MNDQQALTDLGLPKTEKVAVAADLAYSADKAQTWLQHDTWRCHWQEIAWGEHA